MEEEDAEEEGSLVSEGKRYQNNKLRKYDRNLSDD